MGKTIKVGHRLAMHLRRVLGVMLLVAIALSPQKKGFARGPVVGPRGTPQVGPHGPYVFPNGSLGPSLGPFDPISGMGTLGGLDGIASLGLPNFFDANSPDHERVKTIVRMVEATGQSRSVTIIG